jgi:GNAT superfamily N-acetyltransferase
VIRHADGTTAADVAGRVLRELPQWFGIEQSVEEYVAAARQLPTFVATFEGEDVGFLTLKKHTADGAEVLALGVLPHLHRRGIGRKLVEAAASFARDDGVRLLQVKTLGPSHSSGNYARTRAFYASLGFMPLEETTAFWGEANPCLIMVKPL